MGDRYLIANIKFHQTNPVWLTISLQTGSQLETGTLTTCLSNTASIVSEVSLFGIRERALAYVLDKLSFFYNLDPFMPARIYMYIARSMGSVS